MSAGVDQCVCGANLATDNNGMPHSCLKEADILEVIRTLDEASKHVKDRKMMINKKLQKSLSDVITVIEMLGEGKLEVWYGDDLYTLRLQIKKLNANSTKELIK